jgi:SagB-type dehydrogenase family enzyme
MGVGEEFLIQTRYNEYVQTDQMRGVPPPPPEPEFVGTIFELPDPDTCERAEIDISYAIESRESIRNYMEKPLDIAELSYLLWCTQGIKWIFEDSIFKTVPSAGASHPMVTYLAIKNIKNLKPGLYQYIAMEHSLGLVMEDKFISDLLFHASLSQKFVQDAAVCFIWAADSYKMTWRYGERGFRDIFIEAGHICQNLYLAAQVINCGVCAVGAFNDDEINNLLNLSGERFVVYMAAIGKMITISD